MRMRGGSEGESWGCSHCPDRWTETATAGAEGMRGRGGGEGGEEEEEEKGKEEGWHPSERRAVLHFNMADAHLHI